VAAPAPEALPRGTETILFVASDPSQRAYAPWILRELGYHVIEVADGQEAICLLHSCPHRRVDLVIADALMPRVCGKSLAHRIAAILPKSRIALISHQSAAAVSHLDPLHAELGFIPKSATRTQLASKVRALLDAAAAEELQFTPAEELAEVQVA
jgi:DNA-binding NtrC family response regulator